VVSVSFLVMFNKHFSNKEYNKYFSNFPIYSCKCVFLNTVYKCVIPKIIHSYVLAFGLNYISVYPVNNIGLTINVICKAAISFVQRNVYIIFSGVILLANKHCPYLFVDV
jgi:hypothetical protein